MGEVSFDTLEALGRVPVQSETAASNVSGYKRWTVVEGPFKVEHNFYHQGSGDDFAASDTFISGLAHPMFATVQVLGDAANNNDASASVEGVESVALFKTVTVRDAEDVDTTGILVKVYGF